MKSFHFSLHSVRVIRQRKEQVAQKAYADALRAQEAAANLLQRASDALAHASGNLPAQLSSGANAAELRRSRAWCNTLENQQKERATDLQQAGCTASMPPPASC